MMFYNFCGIFVFSLLLVNIFYTFVHGPFNAIFNLEHDIKLIANAITFQHGFNIEHYKVKDDMFEETAGHYLPSS